MTTGHKPILEEPREAHFFDTIQALRADTPIGHAVLGRVPPEQRGKLFDHPWDEHGALFRVPKPNTKPQSDCTFRLDGIQIEFKGRASEHPLLRDGVKFELYIGEVLWPIRALGEEGIFGPKFKPMRWPGEPGFDEVGSVIIPARQIYYVKYELTDEAVRILATHDDVGLAIHLFGQIQRDLA